MIGQEATLYEFHMVIQIFYSTFRKEVRGYAGMFGIGRVVSLLSTGLQDYSSFIMISDGDTRIRIGIWKDSSLGPIPVRNAIEPLDWSSRLYLI
jgi:hypothetical protein